MESATYRICKDIDDQIEKNKTAGIDKGRASIEGISHYAVEAAILKVYGSEVLDFVIDEAVQVHGGMGYSAEMAVERGYRDSRINRIFEGTNEINRLLVVDTAMKRAIKGEFNLFGEAEKLAGNMDSFRKIKIQGESYFEEKLRYIKNFKKAVLLTINGASKQFGKDLVREQEIMMCMSDMIMEAYVSESLTLRIQKMEAMKGTDAVAIYKQILDVFIYDAADKIRKAAHDAINSYGPSETVANYLLSTEILTSVSGVNVKEARRKIADKLISDNAYKF